MDIDDIEREAIDRNMNPAPNRWEHGHRPMGRSFDARRKRYADADFSKVGLDLVPEPISALARSFVRELEDVASGESLVHTS